MNACRNRHAYLLIEYIIYATLLGSVLALAILAIHRTFDGSRNLRRNVDDISRAMTAGERWREDVRTATTAPHLIPQGVALGGVRYEFSDGAVWRKANGSRTVFLSKVASSTFVREQRSHVVAWRWEVELSTPQVVVQLRPLFTFQAVHGNHDE